MRPSPSKVARALSRAGHRQMQRHKREGFAVRTEEDRVVVRHVGRQAKQHHASYARVLIEAGFTVHNTGQRLEVRR